MKGNASHAAMLFAFYAEISAGGALDGFGHVQPLRDDPRAGDSVDLCQGDDVQISSTAGHGIDSGRVAFVVRDFGEAPCVYVESILDDGDLDRVGCVRANGGQRDRREGEEGRCKP